VAPPGHQGDVTEATGKDALDLRLSSFAVAKHRHLGEDLAARLPLCVRSPLPGDRIRFPNGTDRRLTDLFKDHHIPPKERRRIVVVETLGPCPQILLVAAAHLGHRDWRAASLEAGDICVAN
jgi:tRNA(Ile)-lysidine synthetase-like protein